MPSADNLLEMIRSKAEKASAVRAELVAAEVENSAKAEAILGQAEQDQLAVGQAQGLVVRTQQTAQMISQLQVGKAVESAGGFEIFYNLISKAAQTSKEVAGLTEQVRSDQEVSWLSDPARRFRIMLDSDGTYRRLANGTEQLQTLQGLSTILSNQLNQVATVSKAATQSITAASIEASASIVEKDAAIQAAKMRLEGLKHNTFGIQAVSAASDKDLAQAVTVGTFARQEQQYQLALDEEDRRREQFNWMKEKERAIREEKLDDKRFEDRTLYYINLGEISRGLTPSSALQIRDHIKLNKGLGAQYAELYQNGEITARSPNGQAIISTSPGGAAVLFTRDPSLAEALPAEQKKIADILKAATQVLGNKGVRASEGLDDDKTGAKALKVVTAQVQAEIDRQVRYVGANPDNLFFIGEPASYIGTDAKPGVSAFQNYQLTQKILNPAIAANASLADPNVVFGLSLEAIKRGDITTSQAASDFSNIYRRMSMLHRASMDFRKFGITLPPDGSRYNVKLAGDIIDATNNVAVATAMTRAMVKSRFPDYRSGKVVNPGLAKELNRNTKGFADE